MKRYVLFSIILITILNSVLSYNIDLFTFFEMRKDRVVGDNNFLWGAGVDATWKDLTFYAEILETNFQIGDIKPDWPQDVKIVEDTYYPFGPGVLTYEKPAFTLSVGLQNLNEGLGDEYPLFIAANNTPYPSIKWRFSPFDWLSFQQDLLFLRTAVDNPINKEKVQTSKSVYYRKTTFNPFESLKIGFQESVLFMGRDFDLYYLLSPFNYIMSQDIRNTGQAPWDSPVNDNCMVGGFIEYNPSQWRVFGEILVDDWSWSEDEAGVRKIAWNSGLDLTFDNDNFQFELAGASRYTFHKTGRYPYQYVRYETIEELPLPYNMIGYKYGENNAAFSARYEHHFEEADASLGLHYEFLTFGEQDPFSSLPPDWKDKGHFIWLDDPVLQREDTFEVSGNWMVSPGIRLEGTLGTTFVKNEDLKKGQSNTYPTFCISAAYHFTINEKVVDKIKAGKIFEIDYF